MSRTDVLIGLYLAEGMTNEEAREAAGKMLRLENKFFAGHNNKVNAKSEYWMKRTQEAGDNPC